MIKIKKNTASQRVSVTVTEKTTITSPVYIFSFTHDLTKEVKNFTQTNTSAYPERSDLFLITESTTEDLDNGTVELKKGFHSYVIYEAEVESPQELNPDNYSPSLNIVETGKAYVWEVEAELPTFDTGTETEIPTFNG